jgi:cytochrome c oxidase subunit 2
VSVDAYERFWMWIAGLLITVFLGAILLTTGLQAVHPPSHIETIDPTTLADDREFGKPGVAVREDGSAVVVVVAQLFSFSPDPIEVPLGKPVTFRLTSADVIHGFEIVGTNANAMVVPGYVSQFTVTFERAGEYVIACNEFCGVGHHMMTGKVVVKKALP